MWRSCRWCAMGERTLSDYGRAAVALPGFRWMSGMRVRSAAGAHVVSGFVPADAWPDIDHSATAGALEPLLGATLVTWDSREDTRGIEVTWGDGDGPRDHFSAHCETKGRGLVLAAEYRGRWDGGVG